MCFTQVTTTCRNGGKHGRKGQSGAAGRRVPWRGASSWPTHNQLCSLESRGYALGGYFEVGSGAAVSRCRNVPRVGPVSH